MKKIVILGILLTGGLFGCSEADSEYYIIDDKTSQDTPASERYATEYIEPSNPNVDLEDVPKGINDGRATLEYFVMLNNNFDQWTNINNMWNSANISSKSEVNILIEEHKRYASFIEDNLYIEPTTFEERQIHNYLIDFREDAENLISSRISYLEYMSSSDLKASEGYYKSAKASLTNIMRSMNEFDLFYD